MRILKSPWFGAVGALISALWEGFWLIGPPIGVSHAESKWYLLSGLCAWVLTSGQMFYVLKRRVTELEGVLNSTPKLVTRGIADTRTNIHADFYHLKIVNDPAGVQRRETAEKVVGTLQICNEHGKPLVPSRVHRWAASPFIPGFPNASDLQLPVDIDPNGMEHNFDIVHKWEDEAEFFTHNNQSVAKYGYKDPDYKFGPGTYIGNVEIKGKNTSAEFRCKIVNRGKNSKLDISVID